jgi:large subunit ribosomal protein L29
MMRASEVREMSLEKAEQELEEAREAYFKLRFQFATGQLPDTTKLKVARRDIARIATVVGEMERAQEISE